MNKIKRFIIPVLAGMGATENVEYCWGCRLGQPLGKTILQNLLKLNILQSKIFTPRNIFKRSKYINPPKYEYNFTCNGFKLKILQMSINSGMDKLYSNKKHKLLIDNMNETHKLYVQLKKPETRQYMT